MNPFYIFLPNQCFFVFRRAGKRKTLIKEHQFFLNYAFFVLSGEEVKSETKNLFFTCLRTIQVAAEVTHFVHLSMIHFKKKLFTILKMLSFMFSATLNPTRSTVTNLLTHFQRLYIQIKYIQKGRYFCRTL